MKPREFWIVRSRDMDDHYYVFAEKSEALHLYNQLKTEHFLVREVLYYSQPRPFSDEGPEK